ncbi:MAG: hypothetical protein HFJ91_02250 [Muribaculaceae bacterium]|nr:hypothetical protein [Muribaculaceae bacterium]
MFDIEEIERTVRDNKLGLQKISGADKDGLLRRLYDTFIVGDPRALWESFRYVPDRIDCNMEDPYLHLPEVMDMNAVYYFIIDYWNVDLIIFKGRMSDIYTFIGDCDGLDEFYIMTPDYLQLYSITDHDVLYHIDVRRNRPVVAKSQD